MKMQINRIYKYNQNVQIKVVVIIPL